MWRFTDILTDSAGVRHSLGEPVVCLSEWGIVKRHRTGRNRGSGLAGQRLLVGALLLPYLLALMRARTAGPSGPGHRAWESRRGRRRAPSCTDSLRLWNQARGYRPAPSPEQMRRTVLHPALRLLKSHRYRSPGFLRVRR